MSNIEESILPPQPLPSSPSLSPSPSSHPVEPVDILKTQKTTNDDDDDDIMSIDIKLNGESISDIKGIKGPIIRTCLKGFSYGAGIGAIIGGFIGVAISIPVVPFALLSYAVLNVYNKNKTD